MLSAKKPPMSDPHVETPDIPIESAALICDSRPSKSQPTVGSPLQTTCAQRAAPVKPERWKRTIGRSCRRTKSYAAQWYCVG